MVNARRWISGLLLATVWGLVVAHATSGGMGRELRPSTPSPHSGRIAALQSALQNGTVQIPFAPISGYSDEGLDSMNIFRIWDRATVADDLSEISI